MHHHHHNPQGEMHHLRVVLFASGRGSDASSYRPNRDNQWWNRRDALVRCVASFLFGPSSPPSSPSSSPSSSLSELVILFEEDLSRLHMTYQQEERDDKNSPASLLIPTEKTILEIWKSCCKSPNAEVAEKGFVCRLILSSSGASDTTTTTNTTSTTMPPGSNSSKREVLEYLQAHCSVDFLRSHRINATPSVILRKANKSSLLQVYNEWKKEQKQQEQKQSNSTRKRRKPGGTSTITPLGQILQELLEPSVGCTESIAATLHESSDDELPLILPSSSSDTKTIPSSSGTQLCLFLGAVRDMSQDEIQALTGACRNRNVTLCNVRLGPVAEFTSKILTVVAFHHTSGVLYNGLRALVAASAVVVASPQTSKNKKRSREKAIAAADQECSSTTPKMKHCKTQLVVSSYVCFVPLDSTQLSLDLEIRSQLWTLIRCTVVSLWRSRVVSSSSSSSGSTPSGSWSSSSCPNFQNRLVLVFTDDKLIELNEQTVVDMAEKHQAAPSENQVLEVILEQLKQGKEKEQQDRSTSRSFRDLVRNTVQRLIQGSPPTGDNNSSGVGIVGGGTTVAMDVRIDEGVDLAVDFYSDVAHPTTSHGRPENILSLITLVSLRAQHHHHPSQAAAVCPQQRVFMHALNNQGIGIVTTCIKMACMDRVAATLTLLQHFSYQNVGFFQKYACLTHVYGSPSKKARTS